MINVIIPIIDNPDGYSKAINSIARLEDVSVIVGVTAQLEHSLVLPGSIRLKVFKDGSKKEEIINSLQGMIGDGKIIVCRRPFTRSEFDKLATSQTQVTYFERKRGNGLVELFKRTISFLVKFLFGVDFFDGDISLIAFSEDMGQVLQNVSNLSYSTRVDRWRGVEQGTCTSELPPVAMEGDKMANIRLLIFALLSILVPVAITVVVSVFVKVSFVIGMILFCLVVLGVAGGLLLLCSLAFNKIIGKRYFPEAEKA